jgi:hypothetical protein
VVASPPNLAQADEGGVSLWIPGFGGSLAAVPPTPGFSFANIFYHASASGGGDVAFARQVTRGNITANFSGSLNASIKATADLYMAAPSYTFASPFLGGRATASLLVPYGRDKGSVDATLTGAIGPFGFSVSGSATDTLTALGDIAPQFAVAWNAGVHNYMAYITGNLSTGSYDPKRLANTGLGHNAIDVGGAYTYAPRSRCVKIPDQAIARRTGRLCLSTTHLRQRHGRPSRLL